MCDYRACRIIWDVQQWFLASAQGKSSGQKLQISSEAKYFMDVPLSGGIENLEASLKAEENSCSLPTAFPHVMVASAEGWCITKNLCFILASKGFLEVTCRPISYANLNTCSLHWRTQVLAEARDLLALYFCDQDWKFNPFMTTDRENYECFGAPSHICRKRISLPLPEKMWQKYKAHSRME